MQGSASVFTKETVCTPQTILLFGARLLPAECMDVPPSDDQTSDVGLVLVFGASRARVKNFTR